VTPQRMTPTWDKAYCISGHFDGLADLCLWLFPDLYSYYRQNENGICTMNAAIHLSTLVASKRVL